MTLYTVANHEVRAEADQLAVRDVGIALDYSNGLSLKGHVHNTRKTRIGDHVLVTATPQELLYACDSTSKDAVAARHDLKQIRKEIEQIQKEKQKQETAMTTTPNARPTEDATQTPEGLKAMRSMFHETAVRIVSDDPVTIVLKDVADALGYRAADLNRSLSDESSVVHKVHDASGRPNDMICVTRPGLSRLLATLRPQDEKKREKLDKFQDWLYKDVLESIYDTGSYRTQQAQEQSAAITNAEQMAQVVGQVIAPIVSDAVQRGIEEGLKQQYEEPKQLDEGEFTGTNVDDDAFAYAHLVDEPSTLRKKVKKEVDKTAAQTRYGHRQVWTSVYDHVDHHYADVTGYADEQDITKIEAAEQLHTRETPALLALIDHAVYMRS